MWQPTGDGRTRDGRHVDQTMILKLLLFIFLLQGSFYLVNSKPHTKPQETCSQAGELEKNVTLMYGLDNPKVEQHIIAHVRSFQKCVDIACKRENISLVYMSRYDCFGVTCHGEEELCWLLPSFEHPTLVFARLQRGAPSLSDKTKKRKKGHKIH